MLKYAFQIGLGICALFSPPCFSQDLSPNEIPPPTKPLEEYTYKHTPQGDLKLFINFPADWSAQDQRPAIVFFFGGGWNTGSVDQFETQAAYLAKRGMVAARVDYRVKSRHQTSPLDCVEDGKSAVRWLRKNAPVLGVDPGRIAAAGGSAGGHIAACAYSVNGLEAKGEDLSISSKPNLLALYNPVLHFAESPFAKMTQTRQEAEAISPLLHLDSTAPPAVMFFGTQDQYLAAAIDYLKRAESLNVHAELYTAKGEGHAFFNKPPWLERTTYETDRFLVSQGYLEGEPQINPPRYSEMKRYLTSEAKEASAPPIRKGHFQAVFNEYSPLSSVGELNLRMQIGIKVNKLSTHYNSHAYKIEEETFEVYVPEPYQPAEPHGLYVNISPGEKGGIPWKGFTDVLDERKLIWVGANNSGNDQDVYFRRVSLALDAAYNMQVQYHIDPKRVYVGGVSGGGRTSSMTAFHHADVWSGGVFIIGVNYWADMDNPEHKGFEWKAKFQKPKAKYLKLAAENGRYVFLTGDTDGNRSQTLAYYENAYSKFLRHALYLQVPGMGHTLPPVEWMEKALDFLDNPQQK